LEILSHFPANSVNLIYIDPPFNSNRNYEVFWGDTQETRAFNDRYGDALAYIKYMRPRVEQLHRVLRSDGCFFYHCDWHASHYIKVMLDEIFGANRFINEVTWKRSDAHSAAKLGGKHFGRNADSIFFYSKEKRYTFNTLYNPLPDSTITKWYRHVDPATGKRFNNADLTGAGIRHGETGQPWRGIDPTKIGRHWMYPHAKLEELDAAGLITWSKTGKPYQKRFLEDSKGVPLQSIWDDISMLRGITKGAERLGYPTQKPVALLERIIKAGSNPGDLVLDAFCGCGTALIAAQKLGRRWIGIDISPTSCNLMGERLESAKNEIGYSLKPAHAGMSPEDVANTWDDKQKGLVPYYRIANLPRSVAQLRALPGYEFENWAVLQLGEVLKKIYGYDVIARPNRIKSHDYGLDGKVYLVSKVALQNPSDKMLFAQPYIPLQVKHTKNEKTKVQRKDISAFAQDLGRDKRNKGFFIAWDYATGVDEEIERVRKLSPPERRIIIPIRVQQLIDEHLSGELLALMDLWVEAGDSQASDST
jgi:DNA modification methylase